MWQSELRNPDPHCFLEMLDLELFTINTVFKFTQTKNSVFSFSSLIWLAFRS
jgi:hypothetical protein